MTSRQRVLATLNHEEPDRIPIFGPNIIQTHEPYDRQVREFLDTFEFDDLAELPGLVDPPHAMRQQPDQTFVDGYGCRYKYMGVGSPYCTHSPLARAETIADVEAFDWPDPQAAHLIAEDAAERANAIREQGRYATAVSVGALFHQYHYLDEGRGDPVVMLHGNPTWSFMYRKLIKHLRDSHRVVVPDHIGCGLSDKPDAAHYSYTLEQRVKDLEALLEATGIKKNITLVLHDWGGLIGSAFATRNPSAL